MRDISFERVALFFAFWGAEAAVFAFAALGVGATASSDIWTLGSCDCVSVCGACGVGIMMKVSLIFS